MTPVWAVIPTNGRDVFWEALQAASGQCHGVIVVVNNVFEMDSVPGVRVVPSESPSNIHVWWNTGLDAVPSGAHALVLNDDCVLGPGSVQALSEALDTSTSEIAHPYVPDGRERISGWCWMLRAGSALRADESFGWAGDDDLARRADGVVAVPGVLLEHRFPNQFTVSRPELSSQASLDMHLFHTKWGYRP